MVEYSLYLDESGSFTKPGDRTLIGGVLVPGESDPGISGFEDWRKDIRSGIGESGLMDEKGLNLGDEYHFLMLKKKSLEKRKKQLEPAESARFDELYALVKNDLYIFDHCSENVESKKRWRLQPWILQEYMKKLRSVGGAPVIFDNPEGEYHVDSNTTFMAIFASGIVRLYETLRSRHPGESLLLRVNTAERKNITLYDEKELFLFSPMAGTKGTLEAQLYQAQIRNFVLLNGGCQLLSLDAFVSTLESLNVLKDVQRDGKSWPNPATGICDYVCNSSLAMDKHPQLKKILEDAGLLRFEVFGPPPELSTVEVERMVQEDDWGSYLRLMFSRNFREAETDLFFQRLGQARRYDQLQCVNSFVSYLYPFVDSRQNMVSMADQIRRTIEVCDRFEREAYLVLKANLLLYLITLYTHLSRNKDVEQCIKEFYPCISEITKRELRDDLVILFCNRQIVNDTDYFEYKRAREWFLAVKHYTAAGLRFSNALMQDFVLLVGGDDMQDAISVQYGKAVGSYIQCVTKELRTAEGERKESLTAEAEALMAVAFAHFTDPRDINRCHQNLCDLLVELGRYDEALDHLYRAILSQGTAEGFNDQAKELLDEMGSVNQNYRTAFPYLHLSYMMHRGLRTGDAHGEALLSLVLQDKVPKDKVERFLVSPHPEGVVAWHLASSLARREEYRPLAKHMLTKSLEAFRNQGEIFTTIRMAVEAEMIALGLEGKLPGKESEWKAAEKRFYTVTYPDYVSCVVHNPFASFMPGDPGAGNISLLYRMADTVAY